MFKNEGRQFKFFRYFIYFYVWRISNENGIFTPRKQGFCVVFRKALDIIYV